ncbi:uncharacterized protein LOC126894396 isoform X8 [Daktulosphaira vitifoliae]|uniref:uncharacterized protein LOC126894396 isoform X8 n=1 Tax=Daktulosphaira vitifoliae TaxID=58002 RepID=UPI0021AA13C4|nr:uncharacterized protein LOC126894396 isoform X8 [Daktulosphaira vitifoliae]
MNLIILIILLTSISFCIGLSKLELHCNFSKYMFNFFKHNEKYLLNLEQRNNIQPVELEDLNTYGAALKTHGEIIMAMLDALRPFTKRTTAKDLMAINLYLNNVSGSLNFITRNCSGKYNRNLSNVLRGYQLHHKTIVDDLNKFINKKCTNVTVDEDFIKCPDYNKSGIYSIKDLPTFSEKLKNRFKNFDTKNTTTTVNENNVFNLVLTSLNSKKFKNLDPKNLLLFDLLHHNIDNRPFSIHNQDKHTTSIKINKNLDLLRYATFKIKCPNDSFLNISDIFQYMLYSFDVDNMIIFQQLVMAASIQPLIVVARTFSQFANILSISVDQKNIKRKEINFATLVKVGEEIIKNLGLIIHLKMFKSGPENMLNTIFNVLKEVVSRLNHEIVGNSDILKTPVQFMCSFLRSNKLECTIGIIDINKKINVFNFHSIFSIIKQYSQKVTAYITELKTFKELYSNLHSTYYLAFFDVGKNKNFIHDDIIEYVCNQSSYTNLFNQNNEIDIQGETQMEVNKNNDYEFDVEDLVNNLYTDIVESTETTNQQVESVSCANPKSQSKNRPEYIKDYLPFNNF